MAGFILLAVVLTIAAVLLVAWPLVGRRKGTQPAPKAALGAALVIVIGAAGCYLAWSNWTWSEPPDGDLPQNMVARLARQLERNPDDLSG